MQGSQRRNRRSSDRFLRYRPVESHGVIGDQHTAALVATDGTIDWYCVAHFDSPSLFAAILDADKGGYFRISPTVETRQRQMYFPDTNVLLTRFLSEVGVGEVIDFMPVERDAPRKEANFHQIYRMVKVVRGELEFRLECMPAFNYGRDEHRVSVLPNGALFSSDSCAVALHAPTRLDVSGPGVVAHFTVRAGETVTFVLRQVEQGAATDVLATPPLGEQAFDATVAFWRGWLARSQYQGRWREMVDRSALVLKLLTFIPTGAIVAAPTASLPEELGGMRNWDYRFTWVRDASFTLYALLRLGFTREAESFMDWIRQRCEESEDGSLQIMYGLHGEHDLQEVELTHLEGYRGSRPVRIGNAAHRQLQLDIYGELMDAVYLFDKYGSPVSYDFWIHLERLLGYVCDHWQEKDEGIWEVRTHRQHFVYSKLMCWVALNRGIRLARKRGLPGNVPRWLTVQDEVFREIMRKGWNAEKQCFVKHYGSTALDAANLIMPLVRFVSPTDPRILSTLDRTADHLVSDSLVQRYQIDGTGAEDGLSGAEGTFSMCTFWFVEALTRAGRLADARFIFEKMLGYANHLGLYAEQISLTGEALGNFPQGLTHLGLISAAFNLNRALGHHDKWGRAE